MNLEIQGAVELKAGFGQQVPASLRALTKCAGVKVVDHAHLIDDATTRMMADKGVWLSIQRFLDDY